MVLEPADDIQNWEETDYVPEPTQKEIDELEKNPEYYCQSCGRDLYHEHKEDHDPACQFC